MSVVRQDRAFRELDIGVHYEGPGEEILTRFVLPVLQSATSYDRLTGYFSVLSLLAIAQGVEGLWRREGQMRLILGIHDVPAELAIAVDPDSWTKELVASVRRRLLQEVTSLKDELSRNRLATLAWMLEDGLLSVKVAAPRTPADVQEAAAIFHVKRLIFRDASADVVTASGSPNETVSGMGGNFEELTVHMSWQDSRYTDAHVDSFENIWEGRQERLDVTLLDATFAEELLALLGDAAQPALGSVPTQASTISRVLDVMRESPAFAALNVSKAVLYPHQERVFLDAISRWPIRVMLADEVGLGKTLEAGAVIAYAVHHLGLTRVTGLVPAGLLKQWQDELLVHFGLRFWRYDSSARAFASPDDEVIQLPAGAGPTSEGAPGLALISAQLARGTRNGGHIFRAADIFPELLVVDEAHAARVRVDLDGSLRPTLMHRLIEDLSATVPHVVLATATPMQLDVHEYHSLLSLLGLPDWWEKPNNLDRTLAVLASGPRDTTELATAGTALRGIRSTIEEMRPNTGRLGMDAEEQDIVSVATEGTSIGPRQAVAAARDWPRTYSTLAKLHPAHLLTLRNTRPALEKLGYIFAKRNFDAPAIDVPEDVRSFYQSVDIYLREALGEVEQALHPGKNINPGFLKSTYRQRLASSLRAAERTLVRRRDRIEGIASASDSNTPRTLNDEDFELDERGEAAIEMLDGPAASAPDPRVSWACNLELAFLGDLLDRLTRLDVGDLSNDPKLRALVGLVGHHLMEGDQVLVFSRYTDTVDACVEVFRGDPGSDSPAIAQYTGGASWIDLGSGPLPATKEGIRRALEVGDVSIVFCSDAASEGLNLQAARVVINVDVPWNPARLEQRIGRVARLGQRAESVDIYNLWYPDSVEAKIYSRLLARRDLYELAVGQCPAIVGEAIRREIASTHFSDAEPPGREPVEALQEIRQSQQFAAIQRIWDVGVDPLPHSGQLREQIAELIQVQAASAGWKIARHNGSALLTRAQDSIGFTVDAGERDSLSLVHPAISFIEQTNLSDEGPSDVVSVVRDEVAWGVGIRCADHVHIMSQERVGLLLRSLCVDEPIQLVELDVRLASEGDSIAVVEALMGGMRWGPTPDDLSCLLPDVSEPETSSPLSVRAGNGGFSLETLGRVRVEGCA
jgi:superfamily II DNA or RNA helicase